MILRYIKNCVFFSTKNLEDKIQYLRVSDIIFMKENTVLHLVVHLILILQLIQFSIYNYLE